MMTCKFCEDYKELRKLFEEKQARRKSKFVAVLKEELEKSGCCVSYGGYDLNYCPSCGRNLEEKMVRCIDCDHFYARDTQGQAAPVCICRAKIWDGLHRAPHVIGHDSCLPIRCDHFEKKKKEGK